MEKPEHEQMKIVEIDKNDEEKQNKQIKKNT